MAKNPTKWGTKKVVAAPFLPKKNVNLWQQKINKKNVPEEGKSS